MTNPCNILFLKSKNPLGVGVLLKYYCITFVIKLFDSLESYYRLDKMSDIDHRSWFTCPAQEFLRY